MEGPIRRTRGEASFGIEGTRERERDLITSRQSSTWDILKMITRLPQQLLSIIAAPARRHFLCPLHRHFSSPSLLTPISTHTWESSTHTVRQTISNNIPNLYRNKTKLKDSTFWYESVGGMILRRAEKVVFKTMDGHTIETVCLDYDHDMDYHSNIEDGGRGRTTAPSDKMVPATVCISSQVGCCRDCTFCVNSRFGLIRNLTMEELLFQILYFHYVKDSADRHRHIHSVSFHGIGEPLDNPATFELLEFLNSHYPKEYNQPHPPLTSVSTIGSLDHLDILTDRFPHTSLTFSLLSPFQEVREMLAPSVSKDYPLSQV
ncbi:hypothetical protein BKA69DRAFT_410436 [Paraphysoderma sedebokerense]|nr:hypothetical protein BKA69DRAFT_410436 [Paraphysoderma sedebokerense]